MALNDLELLPGRLIGEGRPTFIIAEIGQNHNGDLKIAKELIRKAKECGADCVKFQKSSLSDKFTATALERPYTSIHSFGDSYGDHKRFLEFSNEDYQTLLNFAKDIGIAMTASAMDPVSVDVLIDILKVPFIKIGSGDSNNPFLLEKVAKQTDVKAVISTGMSDMEDVQRIFDTFKQHRTTQNNFVLLHCISSYPTPLESV